MASLDKLEGDAVEGAILAVLLIVIVAAYVAWRSGGDVLAAMANAWRGLLSGAERAWQAFKAVLAGTPTFSGGTGPQTVTLGSTASADYEATDAERAAYAALGDYQGTLTGEGG